MRHATNSSSNAFASLRSRVSKPLVNQLDRRKISLAAKNLLNFWPVIRVDQYSPAMKKKLGAGLSRCTG
jgi:hypothetical protein